MTALISRDDLKAGIDAGTVTVVDALGGDYYAKQHLPGAVALTPGEVDTRAPEVLPERRAGGRPAHRPRVHRRPQVPRGHRRLGRCGPPHRAGLSGHRPGGVTR